MPSRGKVGGKAARYGLDATLTGCHGRARRSPEEEGPPSRGRLRGLRKPHVTLPSRALAWRQMTRSFVSYNHPAMERNFTLGARPPVERRTFLAMMAGGLLAAPLAAEARQQGKVWR